MNRFYFYSASTGNFYAEELRDLYEIPKDAIKISEEEHANLFAGQSEGLQIYAGEDGKPALRPWPKDAQTAMKNNRDVVTKEIDILKEAEEDNDLTESESQLLDELRQYRSKLRRIDVSGKDYEDIDWPTPPEIISGRVI